MNIKKVEKLIRIIILLFFFKENIKKKNLKQFMRIGKRTITCVLYLSKGQVNKKCFLLSEAHSQQIKQEHGIIVQFTFLSMQI